MSAEDTLKIYEQLCCAHLMKALAEELFIISVNNSTTDNEPAKCYHYFPDKVQLITDIFQI